MPLVCPIFDYPLNERLPVLPRQSLRVRHTPQSNPSTAEEPDIGARELLFIRFAQTLDLAPQWARSLRDDYMEDTGFFRLNPASRNGIDLTILCRRFVALATFDRLSSLHEDIPGFSSFDFTQWLLRFVLSSDNPLRKISPYRPPMVRDPLLSLIQDHTLGAYGVRSTVTLSDICAAVTLLHLLDNLPILRSSCDPQNLVRSILSLQTSQGLFASHIGMVSPSKGFFGTEEFYDFVREISGNTWFELAASQLEAVISLTMLDTYFETAGMSRMRSGPFRNSLRKLVETILSPIMGPYELRILASLLGSLELTSSLAGDADLVDCEKVSLEIFSSLGLLPLWESFLEDGGNPTSYKEGVDFESMGLREVLQTTETDSLALLGDHARAGSYSIAASATCFAILSQDAALALLLKLLGQASVNRRFIWDAASLPFFLRKVPVLGRAEPHPVFWHLGRTPSQVAVRNEGTKPLKNLTVECNPNNGLPVTYESRAGTSVDVTIVADSLEPKTLPPGYEARINFHVRRSKRYPRYPRLPSFPSFKIGFEIDGERFSAEYGRFDIQILPTLSVLRKIVDAQPAKAGFDRSTTLDRVRAELYHRYEIWCSLASAERILSHVLPNRHEVWLSQFPRLSRPLIQKLFWAVRFYSVDRIRHCLLETLTKRLPRSLVRNAIFIGSGEHLGKSGTHLLYYVKHAYRAIFPDVTSHELSLRFRHEGHLLRQGQLEIKADAIFFIDDFIGTGTQVRKFLRSFSKLRMEHPPPLYLLLISGFKEARQRVEEEFPQLRGRIVVGEKELTVGNRAFDPSSGIFGSDFERKQAEELCRQIGYALLAKYFKTDAERRRHALGWENSQALIAFSHNTPNNTLPIFWAAGTYQGRAWFPLFPRWE